MLEIIAVLAICTLSAGLIGLEIDERLLRRELSLAGAAQRGSSRSESTLDFEDSERGGL